MGNAVQLLFLIRQLVERKIAQQAADGIRDFRCDLAVADDDLAAAELGAAVYRQGHILKAVAQDDNVVVIVADGGGHCAAADAESAHERLADVAVFSVALDLSNIQHVLLHIALHHAVHDRKLHVAAARKGDVGQRVHYKRLDLLCLGRHVGLEAVSGNRLAQVNGIQHAGIVLRGFIMHEQLAVIGDLAAAGKRGQHAEIFRSGGDVDIRAAAGSESSDLTVKIERAGTVDRDHLNGFYEIQPHAERRAERVVQMAALLQIDGMEVVRNDADHGGVQMIFHHGLEKHRHVAGGAALAHHEMAAVAKTLKNVFLAEPFMVGGNAGRHACAHGRAVHIRKMALQRFAGHGECVVKRLEQVGETCHNIGTDTFRQADGVRTAKRAADDLRIEAASARFEIGGKRDMGRNNKIELEVGRFRFLQNRFDAFQTGNNAYLVEVGHDARGAVRENRFRKGPNCQRGAFRMDMSVQESRSQVLSFRIDNTGVLANAVINIADGRDRIAADGHTALVDLTGVNVNDLSVPNDEISRGFAFGDRQ